VAALAGGFLLLWIAFVVLALAATVFWIWMLIDALTTIRDTNEKILWFLVIFFGHFLGAVLYFFIRKGRPQTTT
jgi:hypothetical protein